MDRMYPEDEEKQVGPAPMYGKKLRLKGLHLPEYMFDWLAEESKRQRRTESAIVREILDEHINKQKDQSS